MQAKVNINFTDKQTIKKKMIFITFARGSILDSSNYPNNFLINIQGPFYKGFFD